MFSLGIEPQAAGSGIKYDNDGAMMPPPLLSAMLVSYSALKAHPTAKQIVDVNSRVLWNLGA